MVNQLVTSYVSVAVKDDSLEIVYVPDVAEIEHGGDTYGIGQ